MALVREPPLSGENDSSIILSPRAPSPAAAANRQRQQPEQWVRMNPRVQPPKLDQADKMTSQAFEVFLATLTSQSLVNADATAPHPRGPWAFSSRQVVAALIVAATAASAPVGAQLVRLQAATDEGLSVGALIGELRRLVVQDEKLVLAKNIGKAQVVPKAQGVTFERFVADYQAAWSDDLLARLQGADPELVRQMRVHSLVGALPTSIMAYVHIDLNDPSSTVDVVLDKLRDAVNMVGPDKVAEMYWSWEADAGEPLGMFAATVICYNCDEPGHYARDCREPRRDAREAAEQPQRAPREVPDRPPQRNRSRSSNRKGKSAGTFRK